MSVADILEELPKLSPADRDLLFRRLSEMGAGEFVETPEILAAIDEAEAAPEREDLSSDAFAAKCDALGARKIVFSPFAEQDLEKIVRYIGVITRMRRSVWGRS